ncbi:MAG: S8 family peptidase [Oligoflexia bacterium]|nr:S8 family peptidase [Oligoflexia bacterium]
MDATTRGFFLFFTILYLTACGQENAGKVNTTSFDCAGQAISDSFLIQWKDDVPPEFAAYKLSPDSKVTRFTGVNKTQIENEILHKHRNNYKTAEHEFTLDVEDIQPHAAACNTNLSELPDSWGPIDINASQAWTTLGKQGEDIIVGIVDSGVDTRHPLLQDNIWINTGEIAGNGIDDDQNGYIDDHKGFNFAGMNSDVISGSTHGTHVAGIVAGKTSASTNNFTGVAPKAKIMPLKFIHANSGSVGDAIKAMEYARRHGAKIINASWGGDLCSDVLKDAIVAATVSGTVFVNASGNAGKDLVRAPEWPAVYQLAGKITVGAYNLNQRLSGFSNYGDLVDLAAPGESILSTVPPQVGTAQGKMCAMSGTSMATPFVAGVSALLFSYKPSATPTEIATAISASVVTGQYGVRTKGKLNALGAAQYLMSH